MISGLVRERLSRVAPPVGRVVLGMGLTPNQVTLLGAAGVIGGAVGLLGTGNLLTGAVVVALFLLFDVLDGAMARAGKCGSTFGEVLDSSCDRIADGAIFASLAFFYFTSPHNRVAAVACLVILVSSQTMAYITARAQSVRLFIGWSLVERDEHNAVGLLAAVLTRLGKPDAATTLLSLLAAACLATVGQRLIQTRIASRLKQRT